MDKSKDQPVWDKLRTEMRRSQILDAAAEMIAQKGFHRTSMKEIAGAAEVAEGTIYNYFADKDALLMALVTKLVDIDQERDLFTASLEINLNEFLVDYFEQRMKSMGASADLLQAVLPEIIANPDLRAQYYQKNLAPAMKQLEAHLQERMQRGEIKDSDLELLVRVFSATLLGLGLLEILGDPLTQSAWENPRRLAGQVSEMLLSNLQG